MDILSTQVNLAGYKAVVEAFANFKSSSNDDDSSWNNSSSKNFSCTGVAGLQAIATAKRMGGIVFATDVRMSSKEQAESLGGKFLTVEVENLETSGGYAKETSDEFKKQEDSSKH